MKNVGIGTRVLNFLVDTIIIFIISYIAFHGWVFYATYYHIVYMPFANIFFSTIFVYYLFFEGLFARSPGKWISYSKVVDRKGGKPSFFQVLVRCLIRLTIIDCFFIPFLDKTLHDYVSKTEVVEV